MQSFDMAAQFEQMETHVENIANLMAAYYNSLVEKGVKDDLAQKLVCEFNRAMWSMLGHSVES
jgi:uncharacterized protein (UPF0297 family)